MSEEDAEAGQVQPEDGPVLQPVAATPNESRSPWKELARRQRLLVVFVVLALELALLFAAASIPIAASSQQALQNEAKSLAQTTDTMTPVALFAYIFTHNALIAFSEMIPIVGGFLWVVSIYATGQVIQVEAIMQGSTGATYGVLLLVLPFAIVELSAYAVAVASGTLLIVSLRRHSVRQEVKVLGVEAGLVAGLLLTAAAMETVTIADPLVGLLLWVPMGLGVAAVAWASTSK